MKIMSVGKAEHKDLVGKIVSQLARDAGKDPWDWFLDFGLADDLEAEFECQLFNVDEDRVVDLLRHPAAAVTLSDAGAPFRSYAMRASGCTSWATGPETGVI